MKKIGVLLVVVLMLSLVGVLVMNLVNGAIVPPSEREKVLFVTQYL